MGYGRSRLTSADVAREQESSFRGHWERCHQCGNFDGQVRNLGYLCVKGSRLYQDAYRARQSCLRQGVKPPFSSVF